MTYAQKNKDKKGKKKFEEWNKEEIKIDNNNNNNNNDYNDSNKKRKHRKSQLKRL